MAISFLKPHDAIGIAAPASSFSKEAFLSGIKLIEALGFQTLYRDDIFADEHGFAGDDARRLSELEALFANPKVKAILFARGGWGMARIISKLDLSLIEKNPKLLLGYSDLTTLHLHLYAHLKWPFFYGPVVAKSLSEENLPSLQRALMGEFFNREIEIPDAETLIPGTANGPIAGGCLTLLSTSCGTPYGMPFRDHILFIEDVGEKPYRIDRALTHLRESGRLAGIRGVLAGNFQNCGEESEIKRILLDHFGTLHIPIVWKTRYGHVEHMHTLPLGIPSTLKTSPTPTLNFSTL